MIPRKRDAAAAVSWANDATRENGLRLVRGKGPRLDFTLKIRKRLNWGRWKRFMRRWKGDAAAPVSQPSVATRENAIPLVGPKGPVD